VLRTRRPSFVTVSLANQYGVNCDALDQQLLLCVTGRAEELGCKNLDFFGGGGLKTQKPSLCFYVFKFLLCNFIIKPHIQILIVI